MIGFVGIAMVFVMVFGGYLAAHYFSPPEPLAHVSAATVESLKSLNLNYSQDDVPLVPEFYDWSSLFTWRGLLIIVGGGIMVGFGARYAGGCTSGHMMSGISQTSLSGYLFAAGVFATAVPVALWLYRRDAKGTMGGAA